MTIKLRRPAAIAAAVLALGLGAFAAAPAQAHSATAATPVVAHAAVSTAAGSNTVRPELLPIPLQQGDSGSAVSLWQQDLNAYIDAPPPSCRPTLTVDGSFGALTTAATKCFQRALSLTPDGIVGTQTRGAMCSFLAAINDTSLHNATCD